MAGGHINWREKPHICNFEQYNRRLFLEVAAAEFSEPRANPSRCGLSGENKL
jgi:hypothetical protein